MTVGGMAAKVGRRFIEREMTSTCTIFTSGEPVTDPQTGEVTTGQTVIWSGPCRVRPWDKNSVRPDVAGVPVVSFDYMVAVPFTVSAVIEGHRLTVTDSPDPALAGVTLEVQKVERGDNLSARRLSCREVV